MRSRRRASVGPRGGTRQKPTARAEEAGAGARRLRRAHDLLDYLVRPQQQRRRDGESERLRGPQVNDELELRRLLDGDLNPSRLLGLDGERRGEHGSQASDEGAAVHRGRDASAHGKNEQGPWRTPSASVHDG